MPLTACKQYCLVAGATQGNIAYTQNVGRKFEPQEKRKTKWQQKIKPPKLKST